MLNAYISKDDVLKLLNETEDVEGFINRSDFQKKLGGLKGVKKPMPIIRIRIKNRESLILDIDSYLFKVKEGSVKPEITSFFEDIAGINLLSFGGKIKSLTESGSAEIDVRCLVREAKEVMRILNISKPTFSRFTKIGIIKKHIGKMPRCAWEIGYYNLEEIRTNLSS